MRAPLSSQKQPGKAREAQMSPHTEPYRQPRQAQNQLGRFCHPKLRRTAPQPRGVSGPSYTLSPDTQATRRMGRLPPEETTAFTKQSMAQNQAKGCPPLSVQPGCSLLLRKLLRSSRSHGAASRRFSFAARAKLCFLGVHWAVFSGHADSCMGKP